MFLSHKQSDSKDFARTLHTYFSLQGWTAFLDMEFDGDLQTLTELVASSLHVSLRACAHEG